VGPTATMHSWGNIAVLTCLLAPSLGEDPSLWDVYQSMEPPVDRSDWHIHDPSRITVTEDGTLMIGVTGKAQEDGYNCGLETWFLAPGMTDWQPGQCLLTVKPDWVGREVPGNDGAYWAAGLLDSNTLYYSVASMNDDDMQCIGLARATGTVPHQTWADSGEPVTCTFEPESNPEINMPNSIDPAVLVDGDGSQHLVYGGNRIWLTELDPNTGSQVEDNWWEEGDPTYHYLARGPDSTEDQGETEWIEAAFLHQRADSYYLFVNWYGCCAGVDSTYEIHVGRAGQRTGPYTDRAGRDMKAGAGELLLAGTGVVTQFRLLCRVLAVAD